MKIHNHLLEEAESCPAADVRGAITPEAIVVHYTAGGRAGNSVNWLTRADDNYVSAHLVISRTGHIFQLAPFNRKVLHAGVSVWEGREDLNQWSVGIELANWGTVTPNGSGYVSWSGSPVSANLVKYAVHKNGLPGYWEVYPGDQILSLIEVCSALRYSYGISTIVGHDDVAPTRKVDPGPLLNMEELREEVDRFSTFGSFEEVEDGGKKEEGDLLSALVDACKRSSILQDAVVRVTERVKERENG